MANNKKASKKGVYFRQFSADIGSIEKGESFEVGYFVTVCNHQEKSVYLYDYYEARQLNCTHSRRLPPCRIRNTARAHVGATSGQGR